MFVLIEKVPVPLVPRGDVHGRMIITSLDALIQSPSPNPVTDGCSRRTSLEPMLLVELDCIGVRDGHQLDILQSMHERDLVNCIYEHATYPGTLLPGTEDVNEQTVRSPVDMAQGKPSPFFAFPEDECDGVGEFNVM